LIKLGQTGQDLALAPWDVDARRVLALGVTDPRSQTGPAIEQRQNLGVHAINLLAQLGQ
jgi:hypothetical protein